MNDKQYIERLVQLTDQLEALRNAQNYDPAAYNDVVAKLNRLQRPRPENQKKHRIVRWLRCLFAKSGET